MSSVVVIGAQWGDEGKGRVIDLLAEQAEIVVRHQGGNNAGHTVAVGDKQYKLHLVPSGVLHPGTLCLIGNGVVLDPKSLVEELAYLEREGISTENLKISNRAHIVMPYHRRLDELSEEMRSEGEKIGTTKRGIGPAYMDKAARLGIRVVDLMDPEEFDRRLRINLAEKNHLLERVYGVEGFSFAELKEEFLALADRLRPYVADTSQILYEGAKAGKKILFEGAQGTLLDIDHGTYPYVTSSHPVAGGVCIGAGIGPTMIDKVIGVAKAYTTRVGMGPFPTELHDEIGQQIREKGHEYGTTTGRPRRCGWFDAVIVRYAVRVNGLTSLAVTRLDTLGGFATVKICTGYRYRGEVIREFPASLKVLAECEPIYEELPGWPADISHIRCYEDLPPNLRNYLQRIEELCETKVSIASIGPERSQAVILDSLY